LLFYYFVYTSDQNRMFPPTINDVVVIVSSPLDISGIESTFAHSEIRHHVRILPLSPYPMMSGDIENTLSDLSKNISCIICDEVWLVQKIRSIPRYTRTPLCLYTYRSIDACRKIGMCPIDLLSDPYLSYIEASTYTFQNLLRAVIKQLTVRFPLQLA
jgi:hypothetical protein